MEGGSGVGEAGQAEPFHARPLRIYCRFGEVYRQRNCYWAQNASRAGRGGTEEGGARGAEGKGAKAGQGGRFCGYRATRICIRKNSCAEVLICTPTGNLQLGCCFQGDEVTGARLGLRLGLPLPHQLRVGLRPGVGPAQQFVDVRTDKHTGWATRWQVPVTLA